MTKTKGLSRRHFLLAAGAGSAATAAAALASKGFPGGKARGTADKRATRGYHASGHVESYYRTTKI